MSWLALDIGGANLKLADGRGLADSRPFALWKYPHDLPGELAALLRSAPVARRVAVTMTGELADCFETKTEGVNYILRCVEQAAARCEVLVYLVNGEFASPEEARRAPHLAAASNWHALASYACRYLDGTSRSEYARSEGRESIGDSRGPLGLLIDIGSTTTDIVPLSAERPLNRGLSDVERLARGELVYTGTRRSPVCAVVDRLPWRGRACPIAQEVFATTGDAYVLLEQLQEDPGDRNTADGRPRTRAAAHARMARMLCMDRDTLSYNEAVFAAAAVRDAQLERLHAALDRVVSAMPQLPSMIVLGGEGEFLARQLVSGFSAKPHVVALSQVLGAASSCAAPAHALAVLAREREEAQR